MDGAVQCLQCYCSPHLQFTLLFYKYWKFKFKQKSWQLLSYYRTRKKENISCTFWNSLWIKKKYLFTTNLKTKQPTNLVKLLKFLSSFSPHFFLCNSSAERKFLPYVIYFEILSSPHSFWQLLDGWKNLVYVWSCHWNECHVRGCSVIPKLPPSSFPLHPAASQMLQWTFWIHRDSPLACLMLIFLKPRNADFWLD